MFTGLVQTIGAIVAIRPQGDGLRVTVEARALDFDQVRIGDSMAVDGCCLTVVGIAADTAHLEFDASAETLRCTTGLDESHPVNLEQALRLGDRLGGHLVSGHVDGVGTVRALAPVAGRDATPTSWRLTMDAPRELARFIAEKGSIAVQGVSLTVNAVAGTGFDVNLIPHTLAETTLHLLQPGARVNLEVDQLARYAERLASAPR